MILKPAKHGAFRWEIKKRELTRNNITMEEGNWKTFFVIMIMMFTLYIYIYIFNSFCHTCTFYAFLCRLRVRLFERINWIIFFVMTWAFSERYLSIVFNIFSFFLGDPANLFLRKCLLSRSSPQSADFFISLFDGVVE